MEHFTFVIRDASSLQIFKKNLNELYLTMVNLFDVNNRCTWFLCKLSNIAEYFVS